MLLQGRRSASSQRSGGIHAVEVLLLLPIVLALLLGMVEYCLILSVKQQLATASMQGARVAAQGGGADEVEAAARLVLGSGSLNANATVTSQLTEISGDPVTVTVQVNDASTAVPDMLRWLGFSIQGNPLVGSTILRRE